MVLLYFVGCVAFVMQGAVYARIKVRSCLPERFAADSKGRNEQYQAGFLPLALTGNPVPYKFWPQSHQRLIPTLQYLYATTFWCELVVHLEEVLFVRPPSSLQRLTQGWPSKFLHLIKLKPSSPPWFQSIYFKIVVGGSTMFAVLSFGTIAFWHDNPLVGEGVLSLIGSSLILFSNFVFFKVFYEFPGASQSNRDQPNLTFVP